MVQIPGSHSPSQLRVWLEIGLPVFALGLVFWYYRPDSFSLPDGEGELDLLVAWSFRLAAGGLGGVLALSSAIMGFYLAYSPVYLAKNLARTLGGLWVDREEFRFYLCCFGFLCLLAVIAIWNHETALVLFTVLSGSSPLLMRVLL